MSYATVSRVRRSRRDTNPMEGIAILATVAAGVFASVAVFAVLNLDALSHQRKALPTAMVCFNAKNEQTLGDDWKHCDSVRFYPAKHLPE